MKRASIVDWCSASCLHHAHQLSCRSVRLIIRLSRENAAQTACRAIGLHRHQPLSQLNCEISDRPVFISAFRHSTQLSLARSRSASINNGPTTAYGTRSDVCMHVYNHCWDQSKNLFTHAASLWTGQKFCLSWQTLQATIFKFCIEETRPYIVNRARCTRHRCQFYIMTICYFYDLLNPLNVDDARQQTNKA